jgi:hypothetical protein
MMPVITLSRGLNAVVDENDADLAAFKWSASRGKRTDYAIRSVGRDDNGVQKFVKLHRVIGARIGITGQIDHADRDGLNCRRENLRAATGTQNMANQAHRRDNSSGYKGVSWFGRDSKWRARIKVGATHKTLGYFATKEEAAIAYDQAARSTFGPFAFLNFPCQPQSQS